MRGVTLEEISTATRIAPRFLVALENEHWDELPGGVFNRGFIRAVARFLGLDEDTLVSEYALQTKGRSEPGVVADSPLESKRFADAKLGAGFVIRAVDNSNVAPVNEVARVVDLATKNGIPVQYGVTGGGNDGSVFLRYGSVDIPLGWPLRYSHSPAEVIDTRDVDSLARIVTAIAKSW